MIWLPLSVSCLVQPSGACVKIDADGASLVMRSIYFSLICFAPNFEGQRGTTYIDMWLCLVLIVLQNKSGWALCHAVPIAIANFLLLSSIFIYDSHETGEKKKYGAWGGY